MAAQILVIGIGNLYRGDDGAGIIAARELKSRTCRQVRILELAGEGAALMDAWHAQDGAQPMVILIDAISSGAAPGTIFRLDAGEQPVPVSFFNYSTHAFSLAEAVELARVLGELPPHMIIYGIEGQNYAAGSALSAPVAQALPQLVQQLKREIDEMEASK